MSDKSAGPQRPPFPTQWLAAISGLLVLCGIVLELIRLGWLAWIPILASAVAASAWLVSASRRSARSLDRRVVASLWSALVLILCWPLVGWIFAGLDQASLIGLHSPSRGPLGIFLLTAISFLPFSIVVLGPLTFVIALIARGHSTKETGRDLASVSAAIGCIVPIVGIITGFLWFAASMYSCYAVMC